MATKLTIEIIDDKMETYLGANPDIEPMTRMTYDYSKAQLEAGNVNFTAFTSHVKNMLSMLPNGKSVLSLRGKHPLNTTRTDRVAEYNRVFDQISTIWNEFIAASADDAEDYFLPKESKARKASGNLHYVDGADMTSVLRTKVSTAATAAQKAADAPTPEDN